MTTTDTTAAQPRPVPDVAGRDLGAARAAAESQLATIQRPSGVFTAHQSIDSVADVLADLVGDLERTLAPVLVPLHADMMSGVLSQSDSTKGSPVAESLTASAASLTFSVERLRSLLGRVDV